MPKVSVVIPTRNEEKNISNCLRSLENQDYKDFETVIVDNYSEDGTRSLVEGSAVKFLNYGPERSEQRNYGASQSSGEYLFFVDADMVLDKGVLGEAVRILDTNRFIHALVIPEISVGQGFWAMCRALEKRLYFGDEFVEAPRFFRREEFWQVGGYSPGMISGEDWDLRDRFLSVGYKAGRISSLIFHNEGRLQFWTAIRKKALYANYSKEYFSRNKLNAKKVFRFFFRKGFLLNSAYIFKDPIHFLGLLVLKTGENLAGIAGFFLIDKERQ